jgi:FkbM family methyltransferase
MAEYSWIQENLDLRNQNIIDAGAHHGHYSAYFSSLGGNVTAVEPLSSNAALIRVNAAINQFNIKIVEAAVSDQVGQATFIPRSNGKLFAGVGINILAITLPEIDSTATIVKLDVEGAEFRVCPLAIDMMPGVFAWIIECHSRVGSADKLAMDFARRGFRVSYLDRISNRVVGFDPSKPITGTTTIFCVKK